MKTKYIFILLILSFHFSYSQLSDIEKLKDWQLIGFAKDAERIGDSYSAVDFYSIYFKRNSAKKDIAFKLAVLYYEIKDYDKAKDIFYDLFNTGDKQYYQSIYYYAKILKTEGNYLDAISYFEKYNEVLPRLLKGDELDLNLYKIFREIEGCELAFDLNRGDEEIKIKHLNNTINKAHMESAPIIWNDTTIIYSSLMVDSLPKILVSESKGGPTNQFYMAKLIDNQWEGSHPAPGPFFNFDSLHTSNGVFSDDKLRFYFTISHENWEGKKISSIYVSHCKRGVWKEPVKLDGRINLKQFTSTQPAIGKCYDPNLDILYFISDRPGGYGGFDIWYTVYERVSKNYKKPVNAGSYINTPGNEVTPFFDKATKSLYFSSDGLTGLGGYDVFKSIGELVNWTPAENLGLPINSGYEDIYYRHEKEREHGFIVSNRKENTILKSPHCCYDIFEFSVFEDNLSEISGIILESNASIHNKLINSDEQIIDDDVRVPSENSIIELHIVNKNTDELIYIDRDTTNAEGKFKFNVEDNKNYQLSIFKNDYTPTKLKFNTKNLKDKLVNFDSLVIVPLDNEPIQLQNIYFEFNESYLTNESKRYIDTSLLVIMNENEEIVIEISAHTDGVGDENYNLELSGKRAESVVMYLTQKGIDQSRIISLGWGEAKPIEAETTQDGTDKPEAREKNRRIEFKVIGLIIENK